MLKMGTEFANKAIECSINNCEHHCCCDNYCSLKQIKVGDHEYDPTDIPSTDCKSFKLKKGCC